MLRDGSHVVIQARLSHGLQMSDALIAATALVHQLPALTGNVKHFAAVPGLRVEGFAA